MERQPVQINHDPFGRFSTMRTSERAEGHTCDWCGNVRRGGFLFRYGTWPDDRAYIGWDSHLFCSVGCYRTYHGA